MHDEAADCGQRVSSRCRPAFPPRRGLSFRRRTRPGRRARSHGVADIIGLGE